MDNHKTYYNPVNGEYTKILESSAQTQGAYSLLEVSLAPGGGNPMHYHTKFTEEFFAVKGTLSIRYEKETLQLQPGESKLVPAGMEHRFFNAGNDTIIFKIVLREGQPDFENFIKVLFGLVRDGKTTKNQLPKNIYHAAILLKWGDTYLKNWLFSLSKPFAHLVYRIAVMKGTDVKLLDKYCR